VDDRIDSDSSEFSLSITSTICYSEESECILDSGDTYHFCFKWEWFASFEKLDGGLVSLGDGHTCQIEGICTVHIKLFDGMVRELKEVRYVSQSTKNLTSVGALEAQGLRGTFREGVRLVSGS